jgi:SOS response regulatory protein OraA/RecX
LALRRLRQTLQAKGLAPDLVASTRCSRPAAPNSNAPAKSGGAASAKPPADAAERARQMRFMAGRGFEATSSGASSKAPTTTDPLRAAGTHRKSPVL